MKKIAYYILTIVILNSCIRNNCNNIIDIKIVSSLTDNYCELVQNSLVRDKNSFRELLLLEVDDDYIFEHGEVILQLINSNGEEFTIELLRDFDRVQKFRLRVYIGAGLQITDINKFEGQSFKSLFPKLNKVLTEDSDFSDL